MWEVFSHSFFFSVCFWLLFLFLPLLQSPICIDWQALYYSIGLLHCFHLFIYFFIWFSVCCSDWVISIILSSTQISHRHWVSQADMKAWTCAPEASAPLPHVGGLRCSPRTCRGGATSSESVRGKRILRRPQSLPSMLINKGTSLLWWAYLHFIYIFSLGFYIVPSTGI